MKFLFSLPMLLAITACSTPQKSPKVVNVVAPHGGVLLKGRAYHVEIVSHKDHVEIYTLKELEAGAVKLIPTKESVVYARYSPSQSKGNWGLPLTFDEAKYMGAVNARGEDTYDLFVNVKVGNTKERYTHTVVMKEKNH